MSKQTVKSIMDWLQQGLDSGLITPETEVCNVSLEHGWGPGLKHTFPVKPCIQEDWKAGKQIEVVSMNGTFEQNQEWPS